MNILLFTNSFLPQIGGREIVVHYLAREYSRMGHDVRVVKPGGFRQMRSEDYPYKVHRLPTLKGYFNDQVFFANLLAEATLWPTDIIHAHSTYPCGYAAARLKKIKDIPLVITPHGVDIHVIPKLNFGLRLDPVKNRKIRYAIEKAEALTAISKSVADSIADAGGRREKIHMIPNGIDIERFQKAADKTELYDWLGLRHDAKIILTVGNYHKRKGQDFLVRAMPAILKSSPLARLVIVGRGTQKLIPIIKELGLEEKVLLTGTLPFMVNVTDGETDRLAALYKHCQLYVSAGIDKEAEGLSLALLDALAAGKPIVATDISGNRDIVEDGKNGLIVEPENAQAIAAGVLGVLSDRQNMEKYEKNSRQKAKSMEWSNIARQYCMLYEKYL